MYALNLEDTTNRIKSATEDQFAPPEQPRVDILPDGDISDYLYVDSEYVYEPLPKPDIEAREQASKQKQEQIDNAADNELSDVIKQHDDLSVELYESLSVNAITNTTVFSESYARKIMRNEITLDDVPSAIKTEVQEIYADKNLTTFHIDGSNAYFDGEVELDKNLHKFTSLTITITANEISRLPTPEELPEHSTFDVPGVENFYERYCSYSLANAGMATLNVVVPSEASTIDISIDSIVINKKKKTTKKKGK